MKKSKVGRPKLADKELKKKSYIMLGISTLLIMILLSGTLVSLNIFNYKKLKGEVTEYPEYKVGDEFCLDTECFYVINDNGDTVTGLAKYNLLVGINLEFTNNYRVTNVEELSTDIDGYGLQNKIARGVMNFNELSYGIIASFSDTRYWNDKESYPVWVFNENSNLWGPLQNYQSYIRNKLDKTSAELSLLTLNQAINLGCTYNADNKKGECDSAPEWLLSSSYWLGTASSDHEIIYISPVTSYVFGTNFLGIGDHDAVPLMGLRPVITIAKSDLIEEEPEPETTTTEVIATTEEVTTTPKKDEPVVATTTTVPSKVETTTTTKKNIVTTATVAVKQENNIINKNKFEEIKGKDENIVIEKENGISIVFNGMDIISEIKDIDTKVEISSTKDSNIVSDDIENGLVVTFANNGKLPGKALIKIPTYLYKTNNDKLYVYYVNNDELELVTNKVNIVNNSYEFYIDHMSSYILTDKKIQSDIQIEKKVKNNNVINKNIILIIVGICMLVAAIVTIIIKRKKQ